MEETFNQLLEKFPPEYRKTLVDISRGFNKEHSYEILYARGTMKNFKSFRLDNSLTKYGRIPEWRLTTPQGNYVDERDILAWLAENT